MTVFETPYFAEFFLSGWIGYLFGYIVHALVRAPRWLVGKLSE